MLNETATQDIPGDWSSSGYIRQINIENAQEFKVEMDSNMFGDDYSKEYIPARDGEYEMTLCTDDKANKLLGWNPKNNINDYIKGVVK